MRAVWTLAGKDLLLLTHDRGGLFFTFVFPLLYAGFIGAIFTGVAGDYKGRRVPALLVDEDRSPESRRLAQRLSDSPELDLLELPRDRAAELVRHGRKPAYVVIPAGFGAATRHALRDPPPRLQMASDPARMPETTLITGVLLGAMFEELKATLSDPLQLRELAAELLRPTAASQPGPAPPEPDWLGAALDAALARLSRDQWSAWLARLEPVRIEALDPNVRRDRPRNLYAVSFPQGMVWGMVGCTASFGVALFLERTRGTARRIQAAPVSAAAILCGKALACFVTLLAVAALLIATAWAVFGVQPRSPGLLLLGVVCIALCFVGLMLLLSTFGSGERSADAICWGVLTLLSMVGGGMVPELLMPDWMRAVGLVSPVKWSIQAVEGAVWREFNLLEMLPACGILLAGGAVLLAAAWVRTLRLWRA